jgi:hypothetical protein
MSSKEVEKVLNKIVEKEAKQVREAITMEEKMKIKKRLRKESMPYCKHNVCGTACKLYMLLYTKQLYINNHINCLVTRK